MNRATVTGRTLPSSKLGVTGISGEEEYTMAQKNI